MQIDFLFFYFFFGPVKKGLVQLSLHCKSACAHGKGSPRVYLEQQASAEATAMCPCDVEQQMGLDNRMLAWACREMTEGPSSVDTAAFRNAQQSVSACLEYVCPMNK